MEKQTQTKQTESTPDARRGPRVVTIALGAAEFVCAEKARNTPAAQVKTFVTAIVGSGTSDTATASATADKVIAAANSKYCG